MRILSFIISSAFCVFCIWDHFETKKKEENGEEFLISSSARIIHILIVYVWVVLSFLMMLGLIEVESKM